MHEKIKKPSKFVMRFFRWFCRSDFREEIEGDLIEQFNTYYKIHGYYKANFKFIKEVILLFRPSIIKTFNQSSNTKTMEIINQNKRIITIITVVITLLLIPFIAMQFSKEVNWSVFDFLFAGILLTITGLILEFILKKIKTFKQRVLYAVILFLILFLVWAELAVGIFGSPFAGT
ncbi:permease prefix domain 2-containing transporter [Polaribacter sp.]|uniref:permease prefix domain 2-containing transporter n=1 Tax=Polaribacter sp. TaxID=1920175 RepID=UPI003F6B0001